MDELEELFKRTSTYCPEEEFSELKNNYNNLFYYKNNNVSIPLDFYHLIYKKTCFYRDSINLNLSYTTNSTINYKINILKLLFKSFSIEVDFNHQVDIIYAIFSTLIFIIDNF